MPKAGVTKWLPMLAASLLLPVGIHVSELHAQQATTSDSATAAIRAQSILAALSPSDLTTLVIGTHETGTSGRTVSALIGARGKRARSSDVAGALTERDILVNTRIRSEAADLVVVEVTGSGSTADTRDAQGDRYFAQYRVTLERLDGVWRVTSVVEQWAG